MFWERFYSLCQEEGIKPNSIREEIGLSSTGAMTRWKNKGITPERRTLEAIAKRFNTTAEYLKGESDDRNPPARIEFIPADPAKVCEHEAKMLQQRQENFERLAQAIKNTPAEAGALNERTEKQLQLFSLMGGLNEAELAEVHGFVDYVMSKRTP